MTSHKATEHSLKSNASSVLPDADVVPFIAAEIAAIQCDFSHPCTFLMFNSQLVLQTPNGDNPSII